ncbi:MAG: putative class aldolase [Ramlibacter sp.]|nr:putative class aldolase [Ramlibacter sp.]
MTQLNIPPFTGDATPDAGLLADLIDANRILFGAGVVDAFGHVSVRNDKRPDQFIMSASMAPAMVGPADLIVFDLEGNALIEDSRSLYAERFIHSEIYKARPDVGAVVHSHSPAVLPFCASRAARLRPVCHMSGFLGSGAGWFEIRDHAGEASDLLVRTGELGASLARSLESHAVVLMRGHGCTVVAEALKVAVYRAIYTNLNAQVQLSAQALGDPIFLSLGEAQATAAANESQVDRAWRLWSEKLPRIPE